MKAYLSILLFFVLVLTISPAIGQIKGTLTPDDFFTNILEYNAGISDGYAIFIIKNPTDSDITIDSSILASEIRKDPIKLSTSIKSTIYYEEVKFNVTYNDLQCTEIVNGTVGNSSEKKDKICVTIKTIREESVWSPIRNFVVHPMEAKKLKIIVTYRASLGDNRHDWVPTLTIAGTEYKQEKWVWFNTTWGNRMDVNLSLYRDNDTIYLNLTQLNITCSNVNCTDAVVVDNNDVELKFASGKLAWQVLLDNVSTRNFPNDKVVAFTPQANSTRYSLYWNNTNASSLGGSLLLWQDNFERYTVGQTPLKMSKSIATQGDVCLVQGNKAAGCNVTGGQFVSWNVTQYTDMSAQFEMNNSQSATNAMAIQTFGTNGYRAPQITSTNVYAINFQGDAVNIGVTASFTGTPTGYNITTQKDGNNLNVWINHVIKFGNASNTSRTTHSEIAYQPAVKESALLSLSVWNFTALTYGVPVNITVSSIQTVPAGIPQINFPLNASYFAGNLTANFTAIGPPSGSTKCWKILDGVETNIGATLLNTINFTFLSNLQEGSHKLTITCETTLINNSVDAFFSVFHTKELRQLFSNPVTEGLQTPLTIIIETTGGIQSLTGISNYTNVIYNSPTQTQSNSTTFNLTVTVTALSPSASSAIASFNWSFYGNYANGSITSTKLSNTSTQTVAQIGLKICVGNDLPVLNFSFFDEETNTLMANHSGPTAYQFESFFIPFSTIIGDIGRNYSFTLSSSNSYTLCPINNISFKINGNIRYLNSTTYTKARFYYIRNEQLSNTTTSFKRLYMLQDTLSTQQIFKVISGTSPAANVIVQVYRIYANESRVVAMAITDSNGLGNTYVHTGIVSYFMNVINSVNTLLYTSGITVFPDSVPTITYNILSQGYANTYQYFNKLTGICSRTSTLLSCTYNDTSGTAQTLTLTLQQFGVLEWTNVCINTTSATSGTITCAIPSAANATFSYDIRGNTTGAATAISDTFSTGSNNLYGTEGLIAAVILMMVVGLMLSFNPSVMVIGEVITLGLLAGFGFIDASGQALTGVTGIIIVGIILAVKMRS